MLAQKPATGCGVYGASNWATSSWVSTISSDAIASSRCAGLRAPVIGAETTGLRDTHARAICARDTPRVAAIDATASTMTLSLDWCCLLYTSDAADDLTRVDLGGRRV